MSTAGPLLCQRQHFEVPDDVSYLDAAAWTALPRRVREAGETGMLTKSRPWTHSRDDVPALAERARTVAAELIGARPDDIAIVGSVSHGIATAARNITPVRDSRILRVAEEFPSLCFAWDRLAAERGLIVEIVPCPTGGDWTTALLEAIARPGAAPLAVATFCPLHWSDGTIIDLDRLAPAVHAAGAALVIDATQSVGAVPIDVMRWRPDFLVFPTYKWVLGPYSLAFLYAAPHRQGGSALEENNGNRPPAIGARCYDKGERNDPIGLPMATTGMEMITGWGVPAISARLRDLTDLLAEGAADLGLTMAPRALRSPHILSVRAPTGFSEGLIDALKSRNVFASARLGGLRLSPHVWANEADVALCLTELRSLLHP